MTAIRIAPFSFFVWLVCAQLSAQIPANPLGLHPLRLNWRQIQTGSVQVIYPEGADGQAQRVANLVHYLWDHNNDPVGGLHQKVTILLHNQTVLSNGFVTVGPFRSEFYLTPPQFGCTTNWLDVLAIHEYRHVKQFANTKRGLTKVAKNILGSWPWGGLFGLALPRWYLEGDATVSETALTASGRGRLPAFHMEYRALLLNDLNYSYEKAGAGSFRDFVPNWYPMGYYMTSYARQEYGSAIWSGVVADAARYKGLFYSFSRSLKEKTGLSTPELYHATITDLKKNWPGLEKSAASSTGKTLNTKVKKTFINYNNPHQLDDGRVVVEKSGFDRIPTYYALDDQGGEERLTTSGRLPDAPLATLSVSSDQLCWAELAFDPRWRNQNFSIIRTYDLRTGKKRKLTSRSRYFSPALSKDGKKIVAVEITTSIEYRLVILDAANGQVLQLLPNPDNQRFAFPRWTADDQQIVVVALEGEKNHLELIDVQTRQSTALTAPSSWQISHPFPAGEYVYFSGAHTGTNNIFALKPADKSLYQLTDVPLGAFQPSVSPGGEQLLYSEFSVQGYDLKKLPLKEALWKPYTGDDPSSLVYAETMAEQTGGTIVDKVPADTFPTRNFNRWSGIINPHSLLPVADHPEYGLRLLSDNKFSTLSAEASAFYNTNESEWSLLAGFTYAELFPEISGRYRRSNRSSVFYRFSPENDTTILSNFFVEEWVEDEVSGGLGIPLNLSQGPFSTFLRFQGDYHRIEINTEGRIDEPGNLRDTIIVPPGSLEDLADIFRDPVGNTAIHTTDLRLIFRSFLRRAYQHLNPRFGINLDFRYRTTFNSELASDVLLGRADLFLPGLSRNHSFYINFAYQREDMLDNYRFSNQFFYPRGYDAVRVDEIFKIGFNYSLPIWYPDLALGPLVFIKRVKANAFFDYGFLQRNAPFSDPPDMRSGGLELTFDFRLLRLLEVDLGVRYSYLLDDRYNGGQAHQFDFLLISISE